MGIFKRLFGGKRPSGRDIQRMEQQIEAELRKAARKRNGGK